jgi:hypothetical protein
MIFANQENNLHIYIKKIFRIIQPNFGARGCCAADFLQRVAGRLCLALCLSGWPYTVLQAPDSAVRAGQKGENISTTRH